MSSFLAPMAERRPDGVRVAQDPLSGRLTRKYSQRDYSPTRPQPIQRDRTRAVPSPQQRAVEGDGNAVAPLLLGFPSVPLGFLGQEPAAAQANATQPRLDPGFIQDNKPISSETFVFTRDCPRLHLLHDHAYYPFSSLTIANPGSPCTLPSLSCLYIASSPPYHAHPHDRLLRLGGIPSVSGQSSDYHSVHQSILMNTSCTHRITLHRPPLAL